MSIPEGNLTKLADLPPRDRTPEISDTEGVVLAPRPAWATWARREDHGGITFIGAAVEVFDEQSGAVSWGRSA